MLRSEIEQRWPDSLRRWRDEPEAVRFPSGESLADVQARLESFVADGVRARSPLVVVTHDVLVRLAALWAAGDPLTRYAIIKSENAGVTEIELGDVPVLVRHNDVSHLGGLRSDLARQAL
jgi:broad specificity phosphatase PhoE